MQKRFGNYIGEDEEEEEEGEVDPESLLRYRRTPRGGARIEWRWTAVNNWQTLSFLGLLCLIFILWLFYVKVLSIGVKITAVPKHDIPLILNYTRLGIAVLATEASPPATLVPQNSTANNATEGHLVRLVCQNTTGNNATESHKMGSVLQNLTANNCTGALLMSNQSQSPSVKHVTEAQLPSKRSDRVRKIQHASRRTRKLRTNKCTAAQFMSKQIKNLKAIKVTVSQPGNSKPTKANNVVGAEAKSSASVLSQSRMLLKFTGESKRDC